MFNQIDATTTDLSAGDLVIHGTSATLFGAVGLSVPAGVTMTSRVAPVRPAGTSRESGRAGLGRLSLRLAPTARP